MAGGVLYHLQSVFFDYVSTQIFIHSVLTTFTIIKNSTIYRAVVIIGTSLRVMYR